MYIPVTRKVGVHQHVLINKDTKKYYDGEDDTTRDLFESKKYNGYSRALKSKEDMDNPDEWQILGVLTTCEIKDIYDWEV